MGWSTWGGPHRVAHPGLNHGAIARKTGSNRLGARVRATARGRCGVRQPPARMRRAARCRVRQLRLPVQSAGPHRGFDPVRAGGRDAAPRVPLRGRNRFEPVFLAVAPWFMKATEMRAHKSGSRPGITEERGAPLRQGLEVGQHAPAQRRQVVGVGVQVQEGLAQPAPRFLNGVGPRRVGGPPDGRR